MDLLKEYEKILSKSCLSLKKGDWIYVHVCPYSYMYWVGLSSGLYQLASDAEKNYSCKYSCKACINVVNPKTGQTRGTCEDRIYDENGRKFEEDFEYYENYPEYTP